MRYLLVNLVLLLMALPFCAADAAPPNASNDTSSSYEGRCQPWDHGIAAREYGWELLWLADAQRMRLVRHYEERVRPSAAPEPDEVIVASHPEWPLVRVIIARGDCIVDIGQMSAEMLQLILRDPGTSTSSRSSINAGAISHLDSTD